MSGPARGATVQCVILAGGLGTRMYPATRTLPKTLLPVAGLPFAHYQLTWMRAHGVTDVVYCIGHLGDAVRDAIGDGAAWGLRARYVDEGDALRGTAGALRRARDLGALEESFLVCYGDSFLRIDFASVLADLARRAEPAVMTVYRNEGRWDASNARVVGRRVDLYRKQSPQTDPSLDHIDYGLAALRASVLDEVPAEGASDLATLYHRLSVEGRLGAYPAAERFFEVGSPGGLADFSRWVDEAWGALR